MNPTMLEALLAHLGRSDEENIEILAGIRSEVYLKWWALQNRIDALAENSSEADHCLALMRRQAEIVSSYMWPDSDGGT
jgi:hypothetical protein